MSQSIEFWVNPDYIKESQVRELDFEPLSDNQIRVAIDRFALTANNVTYAYIGKNLGYWEYHPTGEEGWGKVPAWGCASVIESNNPNVAIGKRLYGFFPMATHTTLLAGKVNQHSIIDTAEHRQKLTPFYNAYRRVDNEPKILHEMQDQRCLLFPLFATSYTLSDYLLDNNYFGAEQILIGSVSSKTGLGLADMLKAQETLSAKVVGLTSERNVDFVRELGACDQIVSYGNENEIDASAPTAYIDMSGNRDLTITLHTLLQDNMKESCLVGMSHWQDTGQMVDIPGTRPRTFFAPAQIAKRDEEWGPGVIMEKATKASIEAAKKIQDGLQIEWINKTADLQSMWQTLVEGEVSPSRGLMVNLRNS